MVTVVLALAMFALPAAAQDQSDEDTVTVTLEEINGSGVTGVAVLTPDDVQTEVSIRLTGAFESHPNHIHENFCDNVDPDPAFPLSHFDVGEADPDGFIRSTVEVPLDDLLSGEYSILVHLSDDQLDEYVACGNIGSAAEAEAAVEADAEEAAVGGPGDAGEAAVSEVPTSGVGTGSQFGLELAALFAGLAALSAGVAVAAAMRVHHAHRS